MSEAIERKAAVRHAGFIKWFDPEKGWGFITPAERIEEMDKPDLFLHVRALNGASLAKVVIDARVSFVVGEHRGRLTAIDVRLEG
jgi:cold shock CspA family protein